MAEQTISRPSAGSHLMRVGIVGDYLEEDWPSMDLVAEMLTANMREQWAEEVHPSLIRPLMARRFSRVPGLPAGLRSKADRLLGRFRDYPRYLRARAGDFDVLHIVDHSYAHLVRAVPASRTVVTCHDLDAFRCILGPARQIGSPVLRAMARRTLVGLRKADRVICVSETTRDEIVKHSLVDTDRLIVIPNGVHPSCSPKSDPTADREVEALLGYPAGQNVEILHVGSTASRKRIDVLLRVIADVRREYPDIRLVRVGGFSEEQHQLVEELELRDHIREMPRLDRAHLNSLYRRAAILLQPSEREGFGLPVVEAMACGLPVLASDLPVMHEVCGEVAEFAPVADVRAWSDALRSLLLERSQDPEAWEVRRQLGIQRAARFSWRENTRKTISVYEEMLAQ